MLLIVLISSAVISGRRIEGILRNPRVQERFQQYSTELRQKALVDIRL